MVIFEQFGNNLFDIWTSRDDMRFWMKVISLLLEPNSKFSNFSHTLVNRYAQTYRSPISLSIVQPETILK